jgi:dihydroflavonol-4-reductase
VSGQIVVTGGSGVVGSALIRHLVEAGEAPLALSRSSGADRVLSALGATPVRGDILEPQTLVDAFAGAGVVYHVAGVNAMCLDDPAPMFRANVTGSRNVVAACRQVEAGRLVYTSSAATIGETGGAVGSERTVHRGWFLSDYEHSKYLAERAVFAEAGELAVVSVNPSSVQGPGRATGTGKLILDLVNGRLPFLVDTRVSIVDVDDCARGHLLAGERGMPGSRYVLNSFTLDLRQAVSMLEDLLGRSVRVRFVPAWFASAGARAVGTATRAVGRRPAVCPEMVRTLRHGHAYDGSLAQRELGITYSGARALLERLLAWFSDEGLM